MADLLDQCIDDLSAPGSERDFNAFQETFCKRCRNPDCIHAKWADDKFSARVATQVDRFFGSPQIAAGENPKYAKIVDFQDCFREAIRLEAADRAGDWEVPEVDIDDGESEVAKVGVTNHVDDAVRQLAKVKGQAEPNLPDPAEAATQDFVAETETLMEEEAGAEPSEEEAPAEPEPEPQARPEAAPPPATMGRGNTPVPDRGIVIGDGPAPTAKKKPGADGDAWTPKKGTKKVAPGATVRMGDGDAKE